MFFDMIGDFFSNHGTELAAGGAGVAAGAVGVKKVQGSPAMQARLLKMRQDAQNKIKHSSQGAVNFIKKDKTEVTPEMIAAQLGVPVEMVRQALREQAEAQAAEMATEGS